MTMEQLEAKINEVFDKSVAPLKEEIKAKQAAGIDTSQLEAAVKKAVEENDKRKSAAAAEWTSLLENARAGADDVKINAKEMIGKIAFAGALALKETNQMHLSDKQLVVDYVKKTYPEDKALYDVVKKDLEAGIPSAGGYGIPQVLLPDAINYLYAKTLLDKLGVQKYPMVNGNMRLARTDTTDSFTWGGELPTGNKTQPGFGDVVLNAKKGSAIVPISNSLLRQNAISIDSLISRDLQRIASIALDNALFYGTGGQYQPLGLANIAGIQTSGAPGSETSLTVQFPINIVALLEQANVPMENVQWVMNPVAKGWLQGKAFTTGPFAWAQEMSMAKTLNGYPFLASATIKNSGAAPTWADIWLADWSELIWGVSYDIALDISREGTYTSGGVTYSAFQRDETLIRLLTECDFNVRHPVSFVHAVVKNT